MFRNQTAAVVSEGCARDQPPKGCHLRDGIAEAAARGPWSSMTRSSSPRRDTDVRLRPPNRKTVRRWHSCSVSSANSSSHRRRLCSTCKDRARSDHFHCAGHDLPVSLRGRLAVDGHTPPPNWMLTREPKIQPSTVLPIQYEPDVHPFSGCRCCPVGARCLRTMARVNASKHARTDQLTCGRAAADHERRHA